MSKRGAAYLAMRPDYQAPVLAPFVDTALVGKRLGFAQLGLVLEYQQSFLSPILEELCYSGTVVARATWCHVRIGSAWAWKASELRVIE